MAIYDYVDGKVVTILVSDGLCAMKQMERDDLTRRFTESMFNLVHPDDAGRLEQQGAAFAKQEAGYDVVSRARTRAGFDYHFYHSIGFYQTVECGKKLAFLYYIDMS